MNCSRQPGDETEPPAADGNGEARAGRKERPLTGSLPGGNAGSGYGIGRTALSSAGKEYVIHIRVVNDTDQFQNIFVFQQDDEPGLMFDKLFPLAWQVFPLPGREEGIVRKGSTEYPPSQQIGVTLPTVPVCDAARGAPAARRHWAVHPDSVTERGGSPVAGGTLVRTEAGTPEETAPDPSGEDRAITGRFLMNAAALRGALTIRADAAKGDAFHYSIDEKGGQHIGRLSDRNEDGSITCLNRCGFRVSIDVYKNDSKIAVWPDLDDGDTARFLLKRNIFFACNDTMAEGATIKTRIQGENVVSVDPAGYSRIEARLSYDADSPGRKKKWIITKS